MLASPRPVSTPASSTATSEAERLSFSPFLPPFVTPDNEPAEGGVRGDVIVVGLVLSLLSFMFITFSVTASYLESNDRVALLAPALRLTHSASFGLAAFCGVGAYARGRNGWFLYVLAGGLPIVQWAVTIYWFVTGRGTERRLLRWTI